MVVETFFSVKVSVSKSAEGEPVMQAATETGRQAGIVSIKSTFAIRPEDFYIYFPPHTTLIHPGSLRLAPYAGKGPQLRTKWR